jgi:putative peptidoglycan lipid II flippase
MKKAVKAVGFMFVMILLSKVLGQAREIIIASIYGASGEATAFYAASTLPLNLFDIVFASAVSSSFIPIYNTYIEKDGEIEADRFASAFINVVFLGSIILTALLMLFSSHLISAVAGGLVGDVRQIAIYLTIAMLPVIIFASLAFSFVGILQSKGEFNIPAMMSLVSNVVIIIYLFFFNKYFGVMGLALSMLIGWILQFLIQIPASIKRGFRYSFILRHKGLKKVLVLSIPVLVGTWIQPITAIINTAFASGLENSQAIPSINYANRLYLIISSVFTVSLTNYIFPKLSKQSVNNEGELYNKTLNTSVKLIFIFLVPIAGIMLALATPIIEVVYKRGAFSSDALYYTAGTFFYYSLGIVFIGLLDLLNKAYYSRKNTLVPSVMAALAIALNIGLSYILKGYMGVFGLALSSSLTALFMASGLFIILNREIKFISKKDILEMSYILAFGLITFAITYYLYILIPIKGSLILNLLSLGISAIFGAVVYFGLLYSFIKEVKIMIKGVFKK